MDCCVATMRDADFFDAEGRFLIVIKVADQLGILREQGQDAEQENGDQKNEGRKMKLYSHSWCSPQMTP